MNLRNKRGITLPIVITFIILAVTASIGLYYSIYFVSKEAGIDAVHKTRGYYMALAGLRYARILLRDPSSLTFTTDPVDGRETATIDVLNDADHSQFRNDINCNAPNNLIITITGPTNGNYDVSASYSY